MLLLLVAVLSLRVVGEKYNLSENSPIHEQMVMGPADSLNNPAPQPYGLGFLLLQGSEKFMDEMCFY